MGYIEDRQKAAAWDAAVQERKVVDARYDEQAKAALAQKGLFNQIINSLLGANNLANSNMSAAGDANTNAAFANKFNLKPMQQQAAAGLAGTQAPNPESDYVFYGADGAKY